MRTSILNNKHRGFSLMELIIALGIFSLLSIGATSLVITSLRSNRVIWEQLDNQNDGRKVLKEVVDVVRRAEASSVGSFPIVTSTEYELTVYANIDSDTVRERVRFYLDTASNTLYQGIIKPTGSPLSYNPLNEAVLPIAFDIVNYEEGNPVFTYFGEGYISSTTVALTQPVNVSEIRAVRVELQIEEDPTQTPVPLHLQSTALIRNLKTN